MAWQAAAEVTEICAGLSGAWQLWRLCAVYTRHALQLLGSRQAWAASKYGCMKLLEEVQSTFFAAIFQQATTMKQFMWQPDLMRVAQFIDAGVRRMREIHPSDGSDI